MIDLKKLRFDNGLTQEQLGEELNITKQQISRIESGKSNLTAEKETYLLNKYGDNLQSKFCNIQTVELDYYPDLDYSCGNGLIPFGYTKEKKKVPISIIHGYSKHKRYVVVNAKSDSMMPEIKPNDLLIIRVIDAEPIIDNHIYVFCHDEHLYCKYLSYNIGQIIVRSANKDYPTRYIFIVFFSVLVSLSVGFSVLLSVVPELPRISR